MKSLFNKIIWSVFVFVLFFVSSQIHVVSADYCTDDYSINQTSGLQNDSCVGRETENECLSEPYYHLNKVTTCKWVTSSNAIPTVISPTASSITATSATLGANVTSLGLPAAISSRGVCYSSTSQFPSSPCKAATGTTTGVFNVNVSSLTPNTLYYYRGYATNTTGTGYSAVSTFTPNGPMPDLIISNPHYIGAEPLYNSAVNLVATVTNIGDASTGTVFHNVFWISNSPDGTNAVSWDDYTGVNGVGPLGPNDEGLGTLQTSTSGVISGDPHDTYIQACADHSGTLQNYAPMSGVIVESNESNNCSAWVPLIPPTVTLTLQPGFGNDGTGKNLVDKDNTAGIGTSRLKAVISNAGTCTLYRNGVVDTISPWSGNTSQDSILVSRIGITDDYDTFSLHCTNGQNYGNVKIYGQSGPLSTSSTSCTIPVGESSCNIPSTWATTNPQANITTWFVGGTPSTAGNSGTNVNVSINGSGVISNGGVSGTTTLATYNKVDGDTNGTSVDNQLASSSTLTISCANESTWNGSICGGVQMDLPDLKSEMGGNTYGAFVNQPKYFSAIITNDPASTASTGTKEFYNLFQVGIDQGVGGGGGSGVGYDKKEKTFWNKIFNRDIASAATEYTIIDNYVAGSTMSNLDIGESDNADSPSITFPSVGTYYIRACADKNSQSSLGVIQELNEGNNCSDWIPVSVTPVPPVPAPDLTAYPPATSLGIMNQQPLTYNIPVGKTLVFYSTISNEGSITTGKSFQNSFQIMSDITQYIANPNPMPMLGVGAISTASKSITFSNVGTYKIRACADIPPAKPGIVSESNEDNNCSGYTTVNVTEPNYPNLITSTVTPTTANIGESTVFSATVTNDPRTGAATAISSNGKGFYNLLQWYNLNDPIQTIHNVTGTDMISTPLLLGESAILSRRVTFSESGLYKVRVCADKSVVGDTIGLVTEVDEGDNCGDWTEIRVGVGANLKASVITPTTAYVGVDTSFYSNIYNEGNASAISSNGKGFFNLLQWYVADDPVMNIHNIDDEEFIGTPFAAGASETITRHVNFSNTGEYMARVCADLDTVETKNNLVVESDEGDNCSGWVLITVTKPSEPIREITATDCEIEDGYSSCETKINWSITSPILGADTAVTTNLPNPYNTELVATGNSGTTTYKLEYTESPRTFYLYHNNIEPPKTAEARATCKNNNWNGIICLSAGEDSLTATDCTIQLNEGTCLSDIAWYTANPVGTSQVTTPGLYDPSNTEIVANGNQGHTTYPVSINDRWFFLYNNGIELKKESGKGFCASGTKWDIGRSACVEIIDFENGVCLDNHNQCSGGDSVDLADTDDYYLWMCKGKNGGSDDNCSEAKNSECPNGALNPPACDCWNPSGCGIGVGGGDVTLTAVPSWIFKGRSSTLTWESWPGATCTINPGNVSLGDTDNLQVSPLTTTTYTAECVDSENNTDSAETTVRVIKPIIFEN